MSILDAPANANTILRLKRAGAQSPIRVVALGDSITNLTSDHVAVIFGTTFWNVMQWQSVGKFRVVRQAGWPSQKTVTIVNRFYDEVLPYRPDAVFILECTNDVGAITGTAPNTYAQIAATALANEAAAIRAAQGCGVLPIIFAMPPRGTQAAPDSLATYTQQLNTARAAQAAQLGALWVDVWTALADPVGLWYANTAWTTDGVHPTALGSQVMATAALAQLAGLLPSYSAPHAIIAGDTGNPFGNPLFSSTGGTAPDTYTFFGTTAGKTQAIVQDAFANGNWARVSWAAGSATTSAFLQSGATDVTQLRGKRVGFVGRLRTQNLAGSGSTVGIKALFANSAGTGISPFMAPIASTDFSIDSPGGISGQGGVFYMEGYVPASAKTVQFQAQYVPGGSGTGTVYADIAEIAIIDIRERPELIDTRASRRPRVIRRVTANYTVTMDDDIILVDATAGAVSITLPPVGVNPYTVTGNTSYGIGLPGSGMQYEVIKVDASANAVTVAAGAGDNIQGSASQSLATQWSKAVVCAVDANLWINT